MRTSVRRSLPSMQFAQLASAGTISAVTASGLDVPFLLRREKDALFTKHTSLQRSLDTLLPDRNLSLPLKRARDCVRDSAKDSLPKTVGQAKCDDFFALTSYLFRRFTKKCAKVLQRRIHFFLSARPVLAPPLRPRRPEIAKAVSTQLPFRWRLSPTSPAKGVFFLALT